MFFYKVKSKKYIIQEEDTCCFVYAVANCMVYLGKKVGAIDLRKACQIAKCEGGSTINKEAIVSYFKAPLIATNEVDEVFEYGGIFSIMHPIYNGHAFFAYKEDTLFRAVNSLLSPPISTAITSQEIRRFVAYNMGNFWRLDVEQPNVKSAYSVSNGSNLNKRGRKRITRSK